VRKSFSKVETHYTAIKQSKMCKFVICQNKMGLRIEQDNEVVALALPHARGEFEIIFKSLNFNRRKFFVFGMSPLMWLPNFNS
jgi:hypothetical protein